MSVISLQPTGLSVKDDDTELGEKAAEPIDQARVLSDTGLAGPMTDCHLLSQVGARIYGAETYLSLRLVLEAAFALDQSPELILATGDLSEDGSTGSYERLRELLASSDRAPQQVAVSRTRLSFSKSFAITRMSAQWSRDIRIKNSSGVAGPLCS